MSQNIKLQPEYDHEGEGMIPYPVWINPETGTVERAHTVIYPGIKSLVGFVLPADPYEIVITFREYAANPDRATGLSPVFENARGMFETHEWTARKPEQNKAVQDITKTMKEQDQ